MTAIYPHHYPNNNHRRKRPLHKPGSVTHFQISNVALCLGLVVLFFYATFQPRPLPQDDELESLRKPATEMEQLKHAAEQESSESRAKNIQRKLGDVSPMSVLREKNTPQHSAYSWLVDDDDMQLNEHSPNLIQRYVLALLYFSTMGGQWKDAVGWLSTAHECEWKQAGPGPRIGVLSCSPDREATELYLVKNNLQGTLPSEIRFLSSLRHLELQGNSLTGTLPEELGYLASLEYLGVSANKFQGTLPATLGGIDHLEQFLAHRNEFVGLIPDSLCQLKLHGRFFNLWSDCKDDKLDCGCCTVCCEQGGTNCGPV